MFFAVAPERALLSDLNSELINAFQVVAKQPDKLVDEIRKIPVTNERYYEIRSIKPNNDIQKAVRFIYLNRTCYGGLYRENKKGKFNTPFGGGSRTPSPLWERNLIANASKLLSRRSIELKVQDFADSIKLAKSGDVVYCDPTFSSVTRTQFDRYGPVIFDWNDQERLAYSAYSAADRGALVLISNTLCNEIRALYNKAILVKFRKKKTIGNKPNNSANHNESLIIIDPQSDIGEWKNLGELM